MTRRHSLARRALMALALMVGFYALALFIVVALLWIPYAEYAYLGRVHIKIALLCVGGAGAILWALLPRADRFDPPGPRVDEAHHPRLWARIREVAAGTGQEMPREVYLLNEVNAWVTHRGGVMGFGSQRVMGIGLPLLQVLSVPQLKAVIAHEFGHYESGDVRLGPWTYKTRAAIGRTLEQLDASWLAKPFEWYASLFVRLTHSVSRQQEFVADAVGARVAGAAAQAGALRRVAALAPAFDTYMRSEVVPVLRAGYLPPVASGFQAFWQVETMADWFTRCANEEARTGISDPFDTHPSLRERLAALGVDETAGDWSAPAPPAIELVDDPEVTVQEVTRYALGPDTAASLAPISWTEVADAVYARTWREVADAHAAWLRQFTVDSLPAGPEGFARAGLALEAGGEQSDVAERVHRAAFVMSAGLAVALLERGWRATTAPGRPVVLERNGDRLDPFTRLGALADGTLTPAAWQDECQRLGLAGTPLGRGQ